MDIMALMKDVTAAYERALGGNLVGMYLHGSAAFSCFTPETGDIDFLVVTREEPAPAQKERMVRVLLDETPRAPKKGFEMSVVLARDCARQAYPVPFCLHFSNYHSERAKADIKAYCAGMHGVDPDLAAHFAVTRAVGVALCGAPIDQVFCPVPRKAYLDSIMYDIGGAGEDIDEDPVYVALNLCRALAYAREGLIMSKKGGGEWAMARVDAQYAPIVSRALRAYAGQPQDFSGLPLRGFAQDMLARIQSEASH